MTGSTYGGRSWRLDRPTRSVVFATFGNPNVQHLYRDWHEAAEPTATSSATSPFGGDDS